jgi:AcrR family transcriptional regulator
MADSEDVRRRILDATVAQIEAGGEASVRLRDVAASAGLAEPSVYHYFGSREELIAVAHAHRFRINLAVMLDPFVRAMQNCGSPEEFEQLVLLVYEASFKAGREAARVTRVEVIGHAAYRPSLRAELTKAMGEALDPAARMLEVAQERGWLRRDIDAKAFVYWNLGAITGLVFVEQMEDDVLLEEFKRLMVAAVRAIVGGACMDWSGTGVVGDH